MTDFRMRADKYTNAETMAKDYLEEFFDSSKIKYPLPIFCCNRQRVLFLLCFNF